MPSIKNITPLQAGSYYHIFNRGINHQNIFFAERNYHYFLQLLAKNMTDVIDVLAYCLMPNHFHLIIRVKEDIEVPVDDKDPIPGRDRILSPQEITAHIPNQFRKMFISYTQAINKQEHREGPLMHPKFKRLEITQQEYLEYAIFYVHYNPEKHGIVKDFRVYSYSSYKAILSESPTKINRSLVVEIFQGKENFVDFHNGWHTEKEAIVLE
jgi:REP element-mobilizing transposase RayT